MKSTIFTFLSILCLTSPLRAQTLAIDSMIIGTDAAALMLYGDFGPTQGMVSLGGSALSIKQWNSNSIECSLQPPSAGVLKVSLNSQTGPGRILEEMEIALERLWSASIGHSGVDGSYNGETYDTLHYYFDETRGEQGTLTVQPYQKNGTWLYQANTEFVDPGMAQCGSYGASGFGVDSSPCSLRISHSLAQLDLESDTVGYRYHASYCRWDSLEDAVTTSVDTGMGTLSFAEFSIAFPLSDSTLVGTEIGLDNVETEDRASGYFFIWISAADHRASSAGLVNGFKIQYPLPISPSSVSVPAIKNHLTIFPDPCTQFVHLFTSQEVQSIEVFGIDGIRRSINIFKKDGGFVLDVQSLPNDFYEVVCRNGNQILTAHFIVAR